MAVKNDDRWVKAVELDDLWEGELMAVTVDGEELIVVHLEGGRVSAFLSSCPHQGTSLADGYLEDDKLVCPAHLWEFNAESGAGVNPDNTCLVQRQVRIEDDAVWIGRPASQAVGHSSTRSNSPDGC